jgi:nitronate monooxygenase
MSPGPDPRGRRYSDPAEPSRWPLGSPGRNPPAPGCRLLRLTAYALPVRSPLAALGVELPVIQAGMGGGLARHELAAAVSEGGGLGTIGLLDPAELRRELERARSLTSSPVAVNILLPFARPAHWEAANGADAVFTFWGAPRRRTDGVWIHQVGSVGEAVRARDAGADGIVAQGVEAGGHVRGELPALELLGRVRAALPDGFPVFVAGGLSDARDVATAVENGAAGAVLGTRFLMTEESRAHRGYKHALVEARETVLTELFGVGWPARHRVVPNRATERWLRSDKRGPRAIRAFNRLTAPAVSRLPSSLQGVWAGAQRPSLPFFSPLAATADRPESLLHSAPLYAGESVRRLDDLPPAGTLTHELAALVGG